MKKIMMLLTIAASFISTSCEKEEDTTPSNPVISKLSPARGPAGTVVSLIGKRFSSNPEANIVKFDGINAKVVSATDTLLQVEAPAEGGSGTVSISVNNRFARGPIFTYGPDYGQFLVSTIAGGNASGDVDGPLGETRLRNPEGVAFDLEGNIIFTDRGNNKIKKMTPEGVVTTVAGTGVSGNTDGPAASARFNGPYKVTVDNKGNIYVADTGNHRIRKITPAGVVSTLAGSSSGYVDGKGTAARFNGPISVATDAQGNVYVADNNNHRIRKVTPDGTVSTFAGNGAGYGEGVWPNAKFRNPSGVFVDPQGNVLVADRNNNRIRKISPQGVVSTIAGNGVEAIVDGESLTASFSEPYGLHIDSRGYIYVAELSGHTVRQISPAGDVSLVAGAGASGFADGIGDNAKFAQPTDVISDGQGNLYLPDLSGHRIRKITLQP
ncbi:MAG: IPT/TIG domain-containing protein [Adhaeribacter sp.]